MHDISYAQLTRKERLYIWLRREGLSCAKIADAIGEKQNTVSLWLSSETIPVLRHKRLVAFGIPADLLPPGVNRRSGPKRKHLLALPPADADAHILTSSTPLCA